MRNQPAIPAPAARSGRRRVVLAALAVLLAVLLVAAGEFTYSRLTAGRGHHPGDTITHTMPSGGSVTFTLEASSAFVDSTAATPGMKLYTVRMLSVNHTSGLINITSAQFSASTMVSDSQGYPSAPSCGQEIAPGDSLTCVLQFSLPQDISQPVVYWLPDGAGNTSEVWWYLAA